jgi:hypothetical protein
MSKHSGYRLQWRNSVSGRTLHLNGAGPALARLVPDTATGLWRVSCDGQLSDIVNLSRASDAAISLALASLKHRSETPQESHPCVISAEMAGDAPQL